MEELAIFDRKDRFRSWNSDLHPAGRHENRGERLFRVVGHAPWHAPGCNNAQVPLKRRCNRRDATGSRWFQPRTADFPLARSERADSFDSRNELAGLSLNRDLQPAPRSTAASTIRDLFTAETVSSNRRDYLTPGLRSVYYAQRALDNGTSGEF